MIEEYDELPNLESTALGILYQIKWRSRKVSRPADFVVKEALAKFVSCLEDDDIGYFYDPNEPDKLCLDPGQLCGKISNTILPFSFDFHKGVNQFVKVLNSIDNYNRIGIVITDHAKDLALLSQLDKGVKTFVFCIDGVKIQKTPLVKYVNIEDVVDLEDALIQIKDCLTLNR